MPPRDAEVVVSYEVWTSRNAREGAQGSRKAPAERTLRERGANPERAQLLPLCGKTSKHRDWRRDFSDRRGFECLLSIGNQP